ncbi:hypothetical protein Lal_00023662 [Lupinus albus]|nr:hypothetical protein Lal_00023662 [Lupinus albus]
MTSSQVTDHNNTPTMKNKVKFELQMIDVSYLVELVPKIPKEVKDQFAKEYGKLLDLILVPIDADALRVMGAMAKYWNPILRIFEFPNVDASPTIKEYEVLLDIPLSNRLRVYLFTGTQDANEDIIKELIGVAPTPSNIIKQGPYYGLKWSFLRKHLDQGDWEMFKPALALAIYGKTLFPFVNDMVDQGAIDVLHKFRKFGVNLVPTILSDTLLAFQKSHEKSIPKIRCCVQLLYVWMMTMFKHHQYPDWSQNPLRRFQNTFVKPMMLSEWEKLFREVTPKNFGTKCNMYDKHDMIIYSCGDYSNMVLMGPMGYLTFAPALVLGQMKWGMTPVREEQLQGFVIWYKDREATDKTIDAVRYSLKRIHISGIHEFGERKAFYTDEYKYWRNERRKGKTIPDADIPPKPVGPSETELLLTGKIKVLGAKLEETRDQKEKHELTIEKLYKIIDAQKKEEISLKRDYANMCSTSEKYSLLRAVKNKDEKIAKLISANEEKDKQISDLNHQLKVRSRALHTAQMDIHVLEAKAERLQAITQDAKNKKNHAWATMKEYQAALDKTLEKENQLKAIMEEMEKAHHQALVEANNDKIYLAEQLTLLEATHKELVTRQQEWSHNWDNMLQECKWDKDRWEERCRKIIDGFGDFADDWLRTFEEARGELHMYPETELRPAMKTFYETCDGLAWKLRKWRIAATRDF